MMEFGSSIAKLHVVGTGACKKKNRPQSLHKNIKAAMALRSDRACVQLQWKCSRIRDSMKSLLQLTTEVSTSRPTFCAVSCRASSNAALSISTRGKAILTTISK
mmetsp:Transcript_9396/g.28330  ORF Transcript_9396/g.28330 Transcript_9396/m.28330 type:complete len:104 (+) Transcript_9396:963-1274(+)